MSAIKLCKLVYICHGYHLALAGKPLFYEAAWAWEYGPIVPEIYHAVKQFGRKPVPAMTLRGFAEPPMLALHPVSRAIISDVVASYGKYSGPELSDATHKTGTPWKMLRQAGERECVIPNGLIKLYYSKLLAPESRECYRDAYSPPVASTAIN